MDIKKSIKELLKIQSIEAEVESLKETIENIDSGAIPIITEVIEARGDGNSKLGERLNKLDTSLNNIKKIIITPEQFGAKGDGVTDDTIAINDALSFYGDRPKKIIFSGDYLVSNRLFVKSNTVLELEGSTILWENYDNIINPENGQTWQGIFNIEGEVTDITTAVTGHSIQYRRSRLDVSDSSKFAIGDYVVIDIYNIPIPQTSNDYVPGFRNIAEVTNVGDGYIIIDITNPFDFSNYNFVGCSVTKVLPCKNVTINNVNIKNITSWENGEGANTKLATGISAIYTHNVTINNVTGDRVQLPLVMGFYARNTHVDNVKNMNPSHRNAGQGYGVKFARSSYGTVKNVYGIMNRHVLDFSGSCYFNAENIFSPKSLGSDFDLHGMCEHDITFNNCRGELVTGNGFHSFSMLIKNITIQKFNGYTQIYNTENLKIIDSDIILRKNTMGDDTIQRVLIKNSDVTFDTSGDFIFDGKTRKPDMITKIKFDNCTIGTTLNNIGVYPYFINFNDVTFKNCDIDFTMVRGVIKYLNCATTKYKSCNLNGLIFNVNRNDAQSFSMYLNDSVYRINNKDNVNYNSQRDVFGLSFIENGVGNVYINNTEIDISNFYDANTPYQILKDINKSNVNVLYNLKNSSITTNRADQGASFVIDNTNTKTEYFLYNNYISKNIFNYKEIWKNKGNLSNQGSDEINVSTKELRIMNNEGNGIGIGVGSDGIVRFKKIVNTSYTNQTDIARIDDMFDIKTKTVRAGYVTEIADLPPTPIKGTMTFVGGTTNKLYIYDGTGWKSVSLV